MFESLFFNKNKETIKPKKTEKKDDIVCKLCHDNIDTKLKDFYSPCLCTGSVGFIHKDCFTELIQMEQTCSVCLTPYPPTNVVQNVINAPPTQLKIDEILDETHKKLDLICYQMNGSNEIQRVLKLFSSDYQFFEMIVNTISEMDVLNNSLTNIDAENFVNAGGRLPTNNQINQNQINQNDILDNLLAENEDSDSEDEEDDEIFDEEIAEDILDSLEKINMMIYNACQYHANGEGNMCYSHTTHLIDELTLTNFRSFLKEYYSDICFHALNYLAKNRIKVWKILALNSIYNTGNIIHNLYRIVKPNWINNLCGLVLYESLPMINYNDKKSFNDKLIDELIEAKNTDVDIDKVNIMENTHKLLHSKEFNMMGYCLFAMNCAMLYGVYYCTSSMFF